MSPIGPKRQRCAIYTRKSTEAGLEQDFNSLDAQREACEAYIKSQANEGWKLLSKHYDDGGLSGGTLERPALQTLLADIAAGKIDVVVVYKVDRLTRSLTDFAKLVERFDAGKVSFVSVTQQFNTTTSMGRLTLNVLLFFAQFEREVISERIRDKVAQSKGIWMGGPVPLGYDLGDRELLVNPTEAAQVETIFELYLETGSVRALKAEIDRRGMRSKVRHYRNGRRTGGGPFSRGHLYALLSNPIYIGKLPHKGRLHDGRQEAIIEECLWERVQAQLRNNKQGREKPTAKHPSLHAGKLWTADGQKLIPSHAVKRRGAEGNSPNGETKTNKRYRYYIEQRLAQDDGVEIKGARFAVPEVERAVIAVLQRFLSRDMDVIAALGIRDGSPALLRRLTHKTKQLSTDIKGCANTNILVSTLIEKVIIHESEIELHISKVGLAESLGLDKANEDTVHVIRTPHKLLRRGQDLKFVLPMLADGEADARRDPALIEAVAKAHLWWGWLRAGEAASLSDIALREGLDKPKVTRLIRLAFLSPDLAHQIIDGKQPVGLTTKALTRVQALPYSWKDQQDLFASFA